MKRAISIYAALTALAISLSLAACNTTKGLGKDVEKAGESMKESAERNGAD
jgi:predicted small secreted protein